MRKRCFLIALLAVMLTTIPLICFVVENEINVKINGEKVNFDVKPIMDNGGVLVPLRKIFEELGADVEWIEETKEIIAIKGDNTIKLKINNSDAYLNNKTITLNVPAKIVDSRTVVPIRFVSESLGAKVDWDNNTRTVLIEIDDEIIEHNTSNNMNKYPNLYAALNQLDLDNYEGIVETNLNLEYVQPKVASKTNIHSKLILDKQGLYSIYEEEGEKKDSDKTENKSVQSYIIVSNNKVYISKDNKNWTVEDINVSDFEEGFKHSGNRRFKVLLDYFENIKEIKVSKVTVNNKDFTEYKINLSDVNSTFFYYHLENSIKDLGFNIDNVKNWMYKVVLNEKNEVEKLQLLSNLEYKKDGFAYKVNIISEAHFDRVKDENFDKIEDLEKFKELIKSFDDE